MRQKSHTSELSSEQIVEGTLRYSQLSVLVGHRLRPSMPLPLLGTRRECHVHGFPPFELARSAL